MTASKTRVHTRPRSFILHNYRFYDNGRIRQFDDCGSVVIIMGTYRKRTQLLYQQAIPFSSGM